MVSKVIDLNPTARPHTLENSDFYEPKTDLSIGYFILLPDSEQLQMCITTRKELNWCIENQHLRTSSCNFSKKHKMYMQVFLNSLKYSFFLKIVFFYSSVFALKVYFCLLFFLVFGDIYWGVSVFSSKNFFKNVVLRRRALQF